MKISEGIHDEGAMKSGSSGFFQYELCVMAKFFNCGFIARWGSVAKAWTFDLICLVMFWPKLQNHPQHIQVNSKCHQSMFYDAKMAPKVDF